MKVLFDITTLGNIHCAPGVHGAGIFNATQAWADELARLDDVALSLSTSPSQYRKALRYLSETGRSHRFALPSLADGSEQSLSVTASHRPVMSGGALNAAAQAAVAVSYSPERVYNPGRFDIYHVGWRGENELPVNAHPSVVLTVFDIIALKHPEWFVGPGEPNPIGDHLTHLLSSARAEHTIVVNTSGVRDDIVDRFSNVSSDQVHVVPLGVSSRFHANSSDDDIARVRAAYGIPAGHRYVLCVNTLEPRKNMSTAIDAYLDLVTEGETDVTLVLAGSKGWLADDLLADRNASPRRSASVVVTGFVADEHMPALYKGASAFCYPSLDEGFGLPVLEAMRCGVPVITSDRPPFREVAGDDAVYVDPLDRSSLTVAMERLLSDGALADRFRADGSRRADYYTWESSTRQLVDVYEHAMSTGRRPMTRHDASDRVPVGAVGKLGRNAPLTFDDLDDMHRGERVFILPEGAQASRTALALFENEYTIALGSFYEAGIGRTWKPSYYLVTGGSISASRAAEINGLTGSTFVFDDRLKSELRTGVDVVWFEVDEPTGNIRGAELFDSDQYATPALLQPQSMALQLAHVLGFEKIYIVDPLVTAGDTSPVLTRAAAVECEAVEWHHSAKQAAARHGREIINTRPDVLFDVYQREDLAFLIEERWPEYRRDSGAHLDETDVIASLFRSKPVQPRVMLDVGAHRGTSARYFVEDQNWTIHCFEPDETNRGHLTRKFGDRPNLTIDPRAVGVTEGERVPFYSSDESSGISGLSAFRESHELVGHVDITTVARIVDDRALDHVDFLKIDVEGFDFGVLKGVPWDRLRPDVIECEFEDAKTMSLGHSSRDVAEYLRARGYTVYFSEWHPIIRYGVRHDWRRVVPYPGVDIPSNSWGNILAFQNDPGMDVVQAAFSARVQTSEAPSPAPATTVPTQPTEQKPKPMKQTNRPPTNSLTPRRWYANRADRLRSSFPALYRVLRLGRRAAARLLRRPLVAALAFLAIVGLVVGGAMVGNDRVGVMLWLIAAALVIGGAFTYLGRYSYRTAHRHVETAKTVRDLRRTAVSYTRVEALEARMARSEAQATEAAKESGRWIDVVSVLQTAVSGLEQAQSAFVVSAQELDGRLGRTADSVQTLGERVERLGKQIRQRVDPVQAQVQVVTKEVERLDGFVQRQRMFSNYGNSPGVRLQARHLTDDDVARIRDHWLNHLGVSMSDRELRYLAHRICMDEERCEGRLATTIQAAVMRSLALLSVRGEHIEFLEIGTLAGVGAGSLYRTARRARRTMAVTLIDPLSGYYDRGVNDGQTGVPIIRDTVEDNLRALDVPLSQYRIIQEVSTSADAIRLASERQYDYLVIDGDHSLQGVSDDFELYGDMVAPGGLLIFDDYDTEDWPAIKPFVDEHVRPRSEWLWIGGEYRTGILQRKRQRADQSEVPDASG